MAIFGIWDHNVGNYEDAPSGYSLGAALGCQRVLAALRRRSFGRSSLLGRGTWRSNCKEPRGSSYSAIMELGLKNHVYICICICMCLYIYICGCSLWGLVPYMYIYIYIVALCLYPLGKWGCPKIRSPFSGACRKGS